VTKAEQLSKNRIQDKKRFSKKELDRYKNFIFRKEEGMCQSGCNREGVEYHHVLRGAYKNDKSIVLTCRECHTIVHFSTDTHEREALNILFKSASIENWREYNA